MGGVSIYTEKQEKANILTHLLGMIFFVPAGFYLIWRGQRFIEQSGFEHGNFLMIALLLMSIFVLMIFTSSVLYHKANAFDRVGWRKFDHIAIFWGIAGFYLPFIVFYYEKMGQGKWLFFLMLGLALLGTVFKLFFLHVNKLFYTLIYLAMGWALLFFGKSFFDILPQNTLILLVFGGLFFMAGVFFYLNKKLYYSHAIWHLLVLAGCMADYFAILSFLVP